MSFAYGAGADPEMTSAFRELIRPPAAPVLDADVKCLEFDFDAGGQALVVGQRKTLRLPWPCRITGCFAYDSVVSSNTFSIHFGTSVEWPVNLPIEDGVASYSMGGAAYLPFDGIAGPSLTNWHLDLVRADVLDVTLLTLPNATTHLLIAIDVRRTYGGDRGFADILTVVDDAGDTVVSDEGFTMVIR